MFARPGISPPPARPRRLFRCTPATSTPPAPTSSPRLSPARSAATGGCWRKRLRSPRRATATFPASPSPTKICSWSASPPTPPPSASERPEVGPDAHGGWCGSPTQRLIQRPGVPTGRARQARQSGQRPGRRRRARRTARQARRIQRRGRRAAARRCPAGPLSEAQTDALKAWVAAGGHLIVCGGADPTPWRRLLHRPAPRRHWPGPEGTTLT